VGPEDLEELLNSINGQIAELGDDAGIFEHNGDKWLQTVDFITPVVNDPFTWGEISAANALSDIYAMGGAPLTALSIACMDLSMGKEIVKDVFRGTVSKLREAGTILLGGHTINDTEPKFGLAVFGITKEKVLEQKGAKPNQVVVLTKPVGVGSVIKALKEKLLKEEEIKEVVENMRILNKNAALLALDIDATACTDITGFGLLGHAYKICKASGVGMLLRFKDVPIYEMAKSLIRKGIYPRGAVKNLNYVKEFLEINGLEEWQVLCLSDPVTSGGLMFTVDRTKISILTKKAKEYKVSFWIIGETISEKIIKVI